MTTQAKQQLKKPKAFSVKNAKAVMQKAVKENQQWLKEMADR